METFNRNNSPIYQRCFFDQKFPNLYKNSSTVNKNFLPLVKISKLYQDKVNQLMMTGQENDFIFIDEFNKEVRN